MKKIISVVMVSVALFAGCKKDAAKSLPSLTTIDASTVDAVNATTGGDISSDGGSAIAKRGIAYAIHPAPGISDSITSDGTGSGTFTSTLSNLFPGTKYYARAYALNGSGTAYGNEISFTTAAGLATVITSPVSNIVPLKAFSGGNVLSDGGSPVTARGLVFATTQHPTITNSKTSDSLGTGAFTDSLTPLASQQIYYVRAYATNSSGTAYGNEISFTSSSADAVTDIDGNAYGYVTIGTQTWMTSNLKVSHYRNGDPITDGSVNNSEFYNGWFASYPPTLTTGAFSYPNGDIANNNLHGKYYDVLDLQDTRGICPLGWHIPSDDEWKTLEISQGMPGDTTDIMGYRGNIGTKLLEGGSSGLNLQRSGQMLIGDGGDKTSYSMFNSAGIYWTSSYAYANQFGSNFWSRGFNILNHIDQIYRSSGSAWGASVRCLKDN